MPKLRAALIAVLLLATVCIAQAQTGGRSGSRGSAGGSAAGQPMGSNQPLASQPTQFQSPVWIRGRVVMDTGQPVPEPVSVALNCGMKLLQAIYTDRQGYFDFVLGAGPQGNMDMTASNDMEGPGGGNQALPAGFRSNHLMGCELKVSVGGYEPLTKDIISGSGDITGVDVGTLQLHRLAGVEGSSISVTSLLVPGSAHKEFDKGANDLRSNHLVSATQHLEKAVSQYDKYAAAWNLLGGIYSSSGKKEEANKAYAKAIASDPHYIPPYVGLAALQLQDEEYKNASETAGRALALDHRIGLASFVQAAAYLRLNRLDDAEKSARNAEQQPHRNIPQVHALLAQIFVHKQDYGNAAAEMRAYLKEAPQGNFVAEIKKSLDEIDKSTAGPPGPPQIAP
jgi:Flp pilus assembly protein TadD